MKLVLVMLLLPLADPAYYLLFNKGASYLVNLRDGPILKRIVADVIDEMPADATEESD